MDADQLKSEVLGVLSTGKNIKVRYECGGDEALIYFDVDGANPFDKKEKVDWGLGDFIVEHLELPSVGEFFVDGDGEIFLENDTVMISYNCTESWTDYDTGDEGTDKMEGKSQLFD